MIENAFKAEQDIKEQSKKVATKIKEITEMVKKDSPSEPEETEEETVIVRTTTIGNNTNVPDTQSKEETRHAPDFHKDKDDSAKEHEDDMRKASASSEKSKESPLKIIGKIELDEKGNVKGLSRKRKRKRKPKPCREHRRPYPNRHKNRSRNIRRKPKTKQRPLNRKKLKNHKKPCKNLLQNRRKRRKPEKKTYRLPWRIRKKTLPVRKKGKDREAARSPA